jgi:hypothetical protein
MAKEKIVCSECGGENVLADAWASWNVEKQEWELYNHFDSKFCEDCDGECSVEWVEI